METVALLIKQGKVRFAGVCNYNSAQLKEAQQYINIVSNQVPYSMVKRDIEHDVVPYCLEHNTSILAYSPLERGLLTGKMKPGYIFQEGDHRAGLYFFTDENIKRTNAFLDKIQPLAINKGVSLGQIVLCWTIAQPGITITLAGARNKFQSVENALALTVNLSPEEIEFINKELSLLRLNKEVKPEPVNINH
jgi:aryl-alcohol dehydrogenase-like predicted oxidoreductase